MNPTPKSVHTELRNIARMQALSYSRIFLLLSSFSSMFYYFIHRYGLYSMHIFFVCLLAPFFLEIGLFSSRPTSKQSLFPELQKKYDYNSARCTCLYITFWCCNLLLLIWYVRAQTYSSASVLANTIPLLLLLGHMLFYYIPLYYYQFKLHYQLSTNQW